jgi:hypothetical protein
VAPSRMMRKIVTMCDQSLQIRVKLGKGKNIYLQLDMYGLKVQCVELRMFSGLRFHENGDVLFLAYGGCH